ncbi:hypothetical protein [Actinomadura chokoriensis]|uniref:Tetratricopeptide repeat protein n=1 Tax=Actinomadura chokoriensis TaxID=454156 RepID=A0ABV4R269_9ACTN
MSDELAELREILVMARPAELRASRSELARRLGTVARRNPANIVHLLFDLLSADPEFVRSDAMNEVMRVWLTAAARDESPRAWGALYALLRRYDADLVACLSAALPRSAALELRDSVRRWLARRLLSTLDAIPDVETGDHRTSWNLLSRVAPPKTPAKAADWLCVLGDLALRRGDTATAMRRYLAAVAGGRRDAAARAGELSQREARRLLASGDIAAGRSWLADALRLEKPTPELRLLDVCTRIATSDTDAVDDIRQLTKRLPAASFWSGIASVIRGDETHAADAFRAFLADPGVAGTETAEVATVLLGALDGNAGRVAAGARALVERHGPAWKDRAPFVPGALTSLLVTLDATDRDPELLTELAEAVSHMPDAAHRLLTAADQAIGHQRFGAARQRLRVAETLLADEDSTFRDHARALRAYLDLAEGADSETYDLLLEDGQRQPWTERAQRAWERGGGIWRGHHLAIVHHARAYDLEAAGDGRAFGYWSTALADWGALHTDDAFWERLARHLTTVMGPSALIGDGGPAAAAERVRERLPRALLAPHITLARELRISDPKRARRHVDVIRDAPFPASIVAEARAALVHDAVQWVTVPVREGRHKAALDELRTWLAIDPTNQGLLRAVLFTGRKRLEQLSEEEGEDWARLGRPLLQELARLVRPFTDAKEEPAGELVTELARFEYWRGRELLDSPQNMMLLSASGPWHLKFSTGVGPASAVPSALSESVARFEAAVRLDPSVRPQADPLRGVALVYCAMIAQRTGDHDRAHGWLAALDELTAAHWTVWSAGTETLIARPGRPGDVELARRLCQRAFDQVQADPDASEDDRSRITALRAKVARWKGPAL